jgi:phosphatidylglycerophosphatase A
MTGAAASRPTAGFLLAHPAHFIALGFGTGLAPVAPGTLGTLLAIPLYDALAEWLAPPALGGTIAGLFLVGVWACGRTGRALGVADHGGMNWDEIVAFLAVLLLAPPGWGWRAFAFVAFRFFDIVKPPPIRHLDRTVKGGFGVMLDDAVAAFYALLALAAARWMLG